MISKRKHASKWLSAWCALWILTGSAAFAGDVTLEQGLDLEANCFGLLCGTEDIIEGTKAFLEKRKAEFHGR